MGCSPTCKHYCLSVADGLEFYRSANNVILSPGNADGLLLPKYFESVVTTSGIVCVRVEVSLVKFSQESS